MTNRKRSLTGVRATGEVHVGNFLGAIRPALARQEEYDCLYFIADMHALTSTKEAREIREHTYNVVAAWLAFGFDSSRHLMYRQSDIPLVTELAWYLSCCTGMGLLEKAHSYKDALAQQKEVNHGVFAYPVLMAADILLYDADIVPVGKDQKQHVEMARDMAGSFNALYGENVLKLPSPHIEEKVMVIPGLDGRKMSKSYGNTIPAFSDEKTLRKLVMSLKTDSTPLDEPKQLSGTLLGQLHELFSSVDEYRDLEARLARGGLGWGHAKEELFMVMNRALSPHRAAFERLRKDEKHLEEVLHDGCRRAFELAHAVLNRVRKAVGFREYPFRLH